MNKVRCNQWDICTATRCPEWLVHDERRTCARANFCLTVSGDVKCVPVYELKRGKKVASVPVVNK